MAVAERSLADDIGIVDIDEGLVWHAEGRVSVLYALGPLHEPNLSDDDFDRIASVAEDVINGLPEETEYQFLTLIEQAADTFEGDVLMPVVQVDERSRVLEELRRSRVQEIVGTGEARIQQRRHYLAASFEPATHRASRLQKLRHSARWLVGGAADKYAGMAARIVEEAATVDKRVSIALAQIGVATRRCVTSEIADVAARLLNPSSTATPLTAQERPEGSEAEWPSGPAVAWNLADDDVAVRRDHLRVGEWFVGVLSLKQLPDRTQPGFLVPLLHLGREKYQVCTRIEIPRQSKELASMRARAVLADGLQLQSFLVKSDRKDAHAAAVGNETTQAMERLVASTQRALGISMTIALYERTPAALDAAVQETLGVLSRAHGTRVTRETYRLKEAWLSLLPGRPAMETRRRRALSPVAADALPVHGFVEGEGKVPFATPTNSLVLYDPFDSRVLPNANILVTGTSGAGKSFLVSYLVSTYDIAAAGAAEPEPYTFILDNGESYKRYAELRPDGRYVAFTFDRPPGVDPFAWSEADGSLDEHVSRLEWLLLDLLHVGNSDGERFERVKATVEQTLYRVYRNGLDRSFAGFDQALREMGGAEALELSKSLYPYVRGKFEGLFRSDAISPVEDDVHVVCYDFKGLGEHRDLASLALRLTIYEIRRKAARVSRQRHRTLLVLDESWALLDSSSGSDVGATGGSFIASSVRMGRKEGMSVIGLSQVIEDFALSSYGAAIVGNSATRFVGKPGGDGVGGLKRHLRLNDRQIQQVLSLKNTPRFHEFLLIQGETIHVVRVPGDSLSRWIFTTSPKDKDTLADIEKRRPELSLLDRIRLLAAKEEQ